MKITWLGQAGLLLETDRATVMIDPYLSDSVVKVNPRNYRRVPVEERFFEVKPDIMIFTHDHLDHFDPETAPRFINNETAVTVLAPTNARALAMKLGVGQNNYVLFDRHTEWTEKGLRFKAVKACHSDSTAIGVIIEDGEKTYYITGDTLYNTEIFADLPQNIDVVFLPINGVGCNMNMEDAARFAEKVGAKTVVPLHFGLFDNLRGEDFPCDKKVVPTYYNEIKI